MSLKTLYLQASLWCTMFDPDFDVLTHILYISTANNKFKYFVNRLCKYKLR